MANEQNLKKWGKDKPKPTSEEAKKNGRLGGLKSGEARAEISKFKKYLEIALQRTVKNRDGKDVSYKEIGAIKLADKFAQGDEKSQTLVLKILGEMPSETTKTEISGINGNPIAFEEKVNIEKVKEFKEMLGV